MLESMYVVYVGGSRMSETKYQASNQNS